jgi:uncharacterized protein
VTQISPRTGHAGAGPFAPTTAQRLTFAPLAGQAEIEGGFWGRYQRLNREVTIPHGMAMLAETGSLHNLALAAGRAQGEYAMPLFRDSDVYKVLEAIAWERVRGRDAAAERFLVQATELAAAAQRPDGYLNSYVEVVEEGRRFANAAMGHELYCAGHLMQAAVADLRTGGDPGGLAAVAGRYADLLAGQIHGELAGYVPGHPEIEMALVEYARAAARPELIPIAAELIARRGHSTLRWHSFGPAYFSDDADFGSATSIRGHAVRALYLMSGAVDTYAETGDPALLRGALSQWGDMAATKTYLTGGVGARHKDEAFGAPFELPPDRAYCETCAAIASVMASWRLLLVTGQARFADLIERTLCNGFLAGLGLDGRSFFYVNPLHARTPVSRQPWYECACCPPNIMRLLATLEHYMATSTPGGVQVHQFAPGRLRADTGDGQVLAAEVVTGYPDDGKIGFRLTQAPGGPTDLAVRVPAWASGVSVELNGRPFGAEPGADRYLHLRRRWSAGDEVGVEFAMGVSAVRPDPRIDAVRGCVAFERGPLVYCLESPDLPAGAGLDDVAAVAGQTPAAVPGAGVAGHQVTALTVAGLVRGAAGDGWPYRRQQPSPPLTPARLRLIPYYAWANRGPAQMRVWLPEH